MALTPPYINEAEGIAIAQNVVDSIPLPKDRYIRDIRDFLHPGETFNNNKSASLTFLIQRAVDSIRFVYLAGGPPASIYFPNGEYKFDTAVLWETGVGIIGESQNGTIFYPQGTASFIDRFTGDPNYIYTDCYFANFTINGEDQNASIYLVGTKGIFIQHMNRATFLNVTIKNTWATGFGVDFLQNTTFVNCTADNCGRGIKQLGIDQSSISGGSGFGIGTGYYQNENVSILNCLAINCGLHGIFTEKQPEGAYLSNGFICTGNTVYGNWIGIRDCGSIGAIITGNQITDNLYTGFSLDITTLTVGAGANGIFKNNVIARNGSLPGGGLQGGGVVIGASNLGSYTIEGNEIFNNTGYGIYAKKNAVVYPGYNIKNNNIKSNSLGDIMFETAMPKLNLLLNESKGSPQSLYFKGLGTESKNVIFRLNHFESPVISDQTLTSLIDNLNVYDTTGIGFLTATSISGTSVSLKWSLASTVDADSVTGYSVQYKVNTDSTWIDTSFAGVLTKTTISPLTLFVNYDFRVATIIGGVIGTYSQISKIATTAPVRIMDNFVRANGDLNGSTASAGPEAKTWAVESSSGLGTFKVFFNTAQVAAGGTPTYATIDPVTAPLKIDATTFKIKTDIPENIKMSLVFRYKDVTNWWRITAHIPGVSVWALQKVVAGVNTTISTSSVMPVAGQKISVIFTGTNFDWYIDGVKINSSIITDTDLSTYVKTGFHGQSDFDLVSRWSNITIY